MSDKIVRPATGEIYSCDNVLSAAFAGNLQESYKLIADAAKSAAAQGEKTLNALGIGAMAIVDKVAEAVKLYALFELLDDDDFFKREKAEKDLGVLGQVAKPYLKELLKDPPSLEVKMRATRLYTKLETADEKFTRNIAELRRGAHAYIDQQEDVPEPVRVLGKKLADALVSGNCKAFEQLMKAEGSEICSKIITLDSLLSPLGIHMSYTANPEALSNGEFSISSNGRNPQRMKFFVTWGLGGPGCTMTDYEVGGKKQTAEEAKAYQNLIGDSLKAATANMK